jgi:hypothetical protein
VCGQAQKRGWNTCPAPSLPAAAIEQVVLDQLRQLLQSPALLQELWQEAVRQQQQELAQINQRQQQQKQELQRLQRRLLALATAPAVEPQLAELAAVQDQLREAQRGAHELQILAAHHTLLTNAEATNAVREFRPVWNQLTVPEQYRLVSLLIAEVAHDGVAGQVTVKFRPEGLQALDPRSEAT